MRGAIRDRYMAAAIYINSCLVRANYTLNRAIPDGQVKVGIVDLHTYTGWPCSSDIKTLDNIWIGGCATTVSTPTKRSKGRIAVDVNWCMRNRFFDFIYTNQCPLASGIVLQEKHQAKEEYHANHDVSREICILFHCSPNLHQFGLLYIELHNLCNRTRLKIAPLLFLIFFGFI